MRSTKLRHQWPSAAAVCVSCPPLIHCACISEQDWHFLIALLPVCPLGCRRCCVLWIRAFVVLALWCLYDAVVAPSLAARPPVAPATGSVGCSLAAPFDDLPAAYARRRRFARSSPMPRSAKTGGRVAMVRYSQRRACQPCTPAYRGTCAPRETYGLGCPSSLATSDYEPLCILSRACRSSEEQSKRLALALTARSRPPETAHLSMPTPAQSG